VVGFDAAGWIASKGTEGADNVLRNGSCSDREAVDPDAVSSRASVD